MRQSAEQRGTPLRQKVENEDRRNWKSFKLQIDMNDG